MQAMELYLWLCRAAHGGALQVVKVVLLASGGVVLRQPWRGPLCDDAAVELAARGSAAANQVIQRIPWSCIGTQHVHEQESYLLLEVRRPPLYSRTHMLTWGMPCNSQGLSWLQGLHWC